MYRMPNCRLRTCYLGQIPGNKSNGTPAGYRSKGRFLLFDRRCQLVLMLPS